MQLQKKSLVMVVELNDFIHVYDNVLESNICQFLIDFFEASSENHERLENNKKPNFTQFNLTENHKYSEDTEKVHNHLIAKVFEYKQKYYEFIDKRCFPEQHNFEQFRIKKYNNDGNDLFDTHVDVIDHESSRRFLSFFWYLNDVETGGETIFCDMTIQPKTGRMVVFPPLWTFPHKGNPPVSNVKYLLSTYLHYK